MPDTPVDREAEQLQERLKSSLWFHIGKLVDEETIKAGVNATPQFIGGLMELVWAQIASVAVDVESFAKHAGRTTVKTDDVMMLARRNEGLEEILKDFVEQLAKQNARDKSQREDKRRKARD